MAIGNGGFVAEPDDLSFIPKTHMAQGEKQRLQMVL